MSLLGINIASRALQAFDREMDVTGQNIANASTPGYSRQVAVVSAVGQDVGDSGTGAPRGVEGGGVDVVAVTRAHAAWLDGSAAALNGQVGSSGLDAQSADQVQNLLAEPTSSGLQTTLTAFYNAFDNLANNPSDAPSRDAAVAASQNVATRINQLSDGLASLQNSILQQAQADVQSVNNDTAQIAGLNQKILQAQAAGNSPNELLDQRDQLLSDLTKLTGATVTGQNSGGDLVVSIAGTPLVQGTHAETLQASSTAPLALTLQSSGAVLPITSGSLGAEQEWVNSRLPGYQQRVTSMAQQLAANVNGILAAGADANGNPGAALFSADAAGHLTVNPAIASNSALLAAGNGTAGDGSAARAISALRSGPSAIDPAYQKLVGDIGSMAAASHTASQGAQAGMQQIEQMQASESGVNLDEELARMVSLQQTYSASAKLLSTYDGMLSTLIQSTSPAG